MEVRQIYYVMEVAKHKNFSKAAQALYITQPTISQQIRNLENELGVTLFTRDTHNVILTQDGEKFCKYGRKVIESIDDLMASFGQNTADDKAILHIGVYTFYKATGLAKRITRFIMDNANTICNVKIVDNYAAYDMLKNGELTFAIIKSRPKYIKRREFEHIELVRDDILTVLTSADSEYASMDHINLSELGTLQLTTGHKNSHIYNEMHELYNENNLEMNIAFSTMEDSDMMVDLISQGFTSTLATRSVADALVNDGIVSIPVEPPQEIRTYLVYNKSRKLTGPEKAFAEHIKILYNA